MAHSGSKAVLVLLALAASVEFHAFAARLGPKNLEQQRLRMETTTTHSTFTGRVAWLKTVLFSGLAFYISSIVMMGTHEILGHGVTGVLLGGSLRGFYLSFLLGVAYFTMPPGPGEWRFIVILAAGAGVNIAVGGVSWVLLDRVHGFAARMFLWLVAFVSIISSIIYIGAEPLLNMALHADQGDFSRIFLMLHISPLLPGAVCLVVGLWVTTRALRLAQGIVQDHLATTRQTGPFRAFWQLALPGVVLTLLHFVVLWPWLDSWVVATDLFFLVVVLAYTGLGALVLARTGRHGRRDTTASPVETPCAPPTRLGRWSSVFALVAVAVLIIFGPTQRLARGVALQTAVPDGFLEVEQEAQIRVVLQPGGSTQLQVTMHPVGSSESPLAQRLADGALQAGPGPRQVTEVLDLVAAMLLHEPKAEIFSPARRIEDAWVMEATAAGVPRQEWTLQLPPGATRWITRIEVEAPGVELVEAQPDGTTVSTAPGRVVWTGFHNKQQNVSLHLRWSS